MRLTEANYQQYYRIYLSLLVSLVANAENSGFPIKKTDIGGDYTVDDYEVDLLHWVFGEGDRIEMLYAFAATNYDNLSEADLDIALSWANVALEEYTIVRRGPDAFFVTDDERVFAVCGMSAEIYNMAPGLPIRARAFLAPFKNNIIFLSALGFISGVLDKDTETRLLSVVDEAAREGRILRTGAQLIASNTEHYGPKDPMPESKRGLDQLMNELTTNHEGILAGLTWEEREETIARMRDEDFGHQEIIDVLDQDCVTGEVVHGLREILRACDTDMLKDNAEAHDIYDDLTKEQLVDVVAGIYDALRPKSVDNMLKMGLPFVQNMRDLHEHGGELRFEKDAITQMSDLPHPLFPDIAFFDADTCYVEVLSDEMMRVCDETDLDAAIARGEQLEEALAYLETAVDYRGLIEQDEALDELGRRFEGLDLQFLTDAVRMRFDNDLIRVGPATFGRTGYFVSSIYFSDGLLDEGLVRALVTQHRRHLATWPTTEQASHGPLTKAWVNYPEGRALAQYLDAHVPGYSHDDIYADTALVTLVIQIKRIPVADELLHQAVLFFSRSKEQDTELAPLVKDFYNALPNPFHNGRTPDYEWDKRAQRRKPKKKRPTKKRRK